MTDQLFSSHWYRVANVKLSLRSHIHVSQHKYRGNTWYVLRDDSSGRHNRFNAATYDFIKLINGVHTVNQIWEMLQETQGDDAPTQEEVIQLLGQLHYSDHLLTELTPDVQEAITRRSKERRRMLFSRISNPMSIRFPLLDPDNFLTHWMPIINPLFTKTAVVAGLLFMFYALLQMTQHWTLLSNHATEEALSPQNLLIMGLVYPFVKGLHELGHGFAVKKWGGEVHEFGVMLLVLMPVPYVDASSSSSFRSKYQRMAVGAAGIIVELLLSSAALLLWLNVQQGIISDILFNVMLIGGVSTLLFNGNPLLRFDGYYVFSDAIEIPGLGNRANRYYGYLVQRYLFNIKELKSPVTSKGEDLWYIFYGAAAFVYRITILVAIALFVAGKYFFIGVLLAFLAVFMQLVLPVLKWTRYLINSPVLAQRRQRALSITAGVISFVVALLFLVPVSLNTITQGVVWMPEHSYVRAGSNGFIKKVLVKDGDFVEAGSRLLVTDDPLMESRIKLLVSQKIELDAQYDSLVHVDLVEAEIAREEITLIEGKIRRMQEQIAELTVTSPVDGIFIVPESKDLHGHYLKQGDHIAYVVDYKDVSIRVVVPQDDIGLVRKNTRAVEIRLEGDIEYRQTSALEREIPAATYRLPSKALAQGGGGIIQTDPFDEKGVNTKDKYFQFELDLPATTKDIYIGQRVYVRFLHDKETLARQWYRSFEELFLDELGRV